MSIKLLGVFLILLSGVSGVAYTARAERKRLAVLDAWIELIRLIRGQIDLFLMPLDEILGTADKRIFSVLGVQGSHVDMQALLASSAPYLEKDCHRHLTTLVRELGGSYREEQLRCCDHCLVQIQAAREELGKHLPARLKTKGAMILCAAMGVALLLW